MNMKFIGLGAMAVLVIAAFAVGSKNKEIAVVKEELPQAEAVVVPNAWIEVVSSTASELDASGKELRELASGDELVAPTTIKTDAKGKAVIHFPDGSVLRVDVGTTATLAESSFDPTNQKLLVRVSLAVGRVWSKIIELATPDSVWEVETSTAVATVRGTAFSMDTDGKKSRVVGSQNNVVVNPIDQKTKKRIAEKKIDVVADTFVEIAAQDIPAIAENKKVVAAAKLSAAISAEPWLVENKGSDTRIEQKIDQLRLQGLDRDSIRGELKEDVRLRFREIIQIPRQERLLQRPAGELAPRLETPIKERLNTESETVIKQPLTPVIQERLNVQIDATAPVERSPSITAKPLELEVFTKATLDAVQEGVRIPFRAVVRFSDGSVKDVTAEAKWGVGGKAGAIVEPGVFVGKIDDTLVESGQATAVVFAIIDTPAGQFTAKSPSFSVRVNVAQNSDQAI